jgi:hypothetical protein
MDTADFAQACQDLAEKLGQEQKAMKYEGSQATTLGERSTNLSAQAATLRTLVVASAIANNDDAVKALSDGTSAAKKAATNLKDAATAIQVSGLVLSLGAAIISKNPVAVINASTSLVKAIGSA